MTTSSYSSRLRAAANHAERLLKEVDGLAVSRGSSLAGDDAATTTDPLSFQVVGLLNVAIDNLNSIRLIVVDAGSLPVYSFQTLLRSAIECVGLALWMLGPTARDERILRAVQTTYESRRDHRALLAELDIGRTAGRTESERDFEDLLQALRERPAIVGRSLRPPSISARLRLAEEFLTRRSADTLTLVLRWKVASAVTHARRHTIWLTSDAAGGEAIPGGFVATMSANLPSTVAAIEAVNEAADDAVVLFRSRSWSASG